MQGYKFRLQKLLDLRKEKEEESKRIFKQAQLEKEGAESKLNCLKDDYNKYRYSSQEESLVQQKLKHIYLNALNTSIAEAKVDLQEKTNTMEEKRENLKQSQVERKTVETLRDKQLEVFIKEQQLNEQKTNDEFALYGFFRTLEGR